MGKKLWKKSHDPWFVIYLSGAKYKGWLDDESDAAKDEDKVDDLKDTARLLEEETGEEGDKHLVEIFL